MRIRITVVEADDLIAAIQSDLSEVALGSALIVEASTSPRMRYDIGSIIREVVLEFEERRIAAARKSKPVTPRKPRTKKTEPAA